MKHTHSRRKIFLIDAFAALGILAITLEAATMLWGGVAFQASVYNPLPDTHQETRFDRQYDTSGITSPSRNGVTACERRTVRVKNLKRRNQLLTLCHINGQ